jgi:hypothetical protein
LLPDARIWLPNALDAWRICKPRVSPAPDTTPAPHWGTLENPVEDIPLTLRDALFACVLGLALGALVALGF